MFRTLATRHSHRIVRKFNPTPNSLRTQSSFSLSTLPTRSLFTVSYPRYADEQKTSTPTPSREGGTAILSLQFVTPNETIVNNQPCYAVTVPAVSGVMGILADHAPTIAQLQPGLVTVSGSDLNDITHRYVISGGFAVVTPESTAYIQAVEAIKVEDLDITAARTNLTEAQNNLAKANGEKEKAEAQIAIDVCEAIIAAIESK